MSDDVLITPASRKIEFKDSGGNVDGTIQLDSSGNLVLTSTVGLLIGDLDADIHIGDGSNVVDMVFDFAGSIYSAANQDLTIGKKSLGGNDVKIESPSPVRVSTASGYIDVGPANTSWSHLSTDRGKFYFNKPIVIDGGNTNGDAYLISSYNTEDFVIATNNGTEDRITVKKATGNVGINTTSPAAKLHVDAPATTAASLTFGATTGQIFQNENSEFAFGLHNASPYPLYIQGRTHTDGVRQIVLNPLGGNVGVGALDADDAPLHVKHTGDGSTSVIIENTNASANEGPIIDLYRSSASPAVNDMIGTILFTGENDNDEKVTYGEIQAFIEDETDATENAAFQFRLYEMGTARENLRIASNQITFNNSERNVDVLIKSDDGSTNFFSDAGNNCIGIGTTSPTFASGSGLHIYNSTQANLRLEDAADEFFDVAMQNGDAYLINRVSDGFISFRTNSTERFKIDSEGANTMYRNDSSTQNALLKLHEDSVYADNPTLEVITDRTDGAIPSISVSGGAVTVSGPNGWNTWEKETFYKKNYGTASGGGSGLINVSHDGQGTINSFPLPYDAKLRAVAITYSFTSSSSSTADQTWRLFHSGDPANVVDNFTFDVANDMTNTHGNFYLYVATGLDITMNKNKTYSVRRESGTLDIQSAVRFDLWYTRHTGNF